MFVYRFVFGNAFLGFVKLFAKLLGLGKKIVVALFLLVGTVKELLEKVMEVRVGCGRGW